MTLRWCLLRKASELYSQIEHLVGSAIRGAVITRLACGLWWGSRVHSFTFEKHVGLHKHHRWVGCNLFSSACSWLVNWKLIFYDHRSEEAWIIEDFPWANYYSLFTRSRARPLIAPAAAAHFNEAIRINFYLFYHLLIEPFRRLNGVVNEENLPEVDGWLTLAQTKVNDKNLNFYVSLPLSGAHKSRRNRDECKIRLRNLWRLSRLFDSTKMKDDSEINDPC